MLLHDLPLQVALRTPEAPALSDKRRCLDYHGLATEIERLAAGFAALGLARNDRVAIFLDSRVETVLACFAISRAGGIFVLVNPILKGHQVRHILDDTGARFLLTGSNRFDAIAADILEAPFETLILIDEDAIHSSSGGRVPVRFSALGEHSPAAVHRASHAVEGTSRRSSIPRAARAFRKGS